MATHGRPQKLPCKFPWLSAAIATAPRIFPRRPARKPAAIAMAVSRMSNRSNLHVHDPRQLPRPSSDSDKQFFFTFINFAPVMLLGGYFVWIGDGVRVRATYMFLKGTTMKHTRCPRARRWVLPWVFPSTHRWMSADVSADSPWVCL